MQHGAVLSGDELHGLNFILRKIDRTKRKRQPSLGFIPAEVDTMPDAASYVINVGRASS